MNSRFKALLFGLLALGFLVTIGAAAGHDKPPLKYPAGTVFNMTGHAIYRTWEVGNGEVVQDVANPCHATLEFFEDNIFRYTFAEDRVGGNAASFYGKMAASGTLMFEFPAPLFVDPVYGPFYITDVIKMHACATLWGPGIDEGTLKFIGKFDGEHFSATGSFMAMVASPCPSNDMFDPALHPGPLHWIFGYELNVAQ